MDSKLAILERDLPYKNTPRNQKTCKITPHHAAGVISWEDYERIAKDREESCNYLIDKDAIVVQFCPEGSRSWCSSSAWNDNRAITIEVSNSAVGGDWPISDKVFNKLVDLCVDICQRNGIDKLEYTGDKNGSLTLHKMFTATACPGPYLESKIPDLCNLVNARIKMAVDPTPDPTPETKKKSNEEVAKDVIAGKYGNMPDRKKRLEADGYIYTDVQKIVDKMMKKTPKKSNEEVAKDVIAGKYGNGGIRKKKLTAEGYDYNAVQKIVDQMLPKAAPAAKPTVGVAHSFNNSYAGQYMVMPNRINVMSCPCSNKQTDIIAVANTKERVQCFGYYEIDGKEKWLYVIYATVKGFVKLSDLRKL